MADFKISDIARRLIRWIEQPPAVSEPNHSPAVDMVQRIAVKVRESVGRVAPLGTGNLRSLASMDAVSRQLNLNIFQTRGLISAIERGYRQLQTQLDTLKRLEAEMKRHIRQLQHVQQNMVMQPGAPVGTTMRQVSKCAADIDEAVARATELEGALRQLAMRSIHWVVSAGRPGSDRGQPGIKSKHRDQGYQHSRIRDGVLFLQGRGDPHRVHHDDVIQRGLANCYQLATYAATAHTDPMAIRRMITDNKNGTYTVRFYVNGQARNVTVDGQFVTSGEQHQTLRYAQFGDVRNTGNGRQQREIWPMVLEKAYAKLQGDYEDIEWDSPYKVFDHISRRGSRTHSTGGMTPGRIISVLQAAQQAGHPAVLSSRDLENLSAPDGAGSGWLATAQSVARRLKINGKHVYYFLRVNGNRAVLRNPWGYDHPTVDGAQIRLYFHTITIGQF